MKLASFSFAGRDHLGFLTPPGAIVDVDDALAASGLAHDAGGWSSMLDLIREGAPLLQRLREAHASASRWLDRVPTYDPARIHWYAPVRAPSKVVCLALNNRALDAIKLRAPTDHPAFFLKPSTAVTGHLCPIRLRTAYGLTHPEPELGVIIGRELRDVTAGAALEGVYGYTIVNDVTSVGMREEDSFSVRYFKPGAQSGEVSVGEAHTTYPGRYKASDTFAPMGPYLVTRDEVPDPASLAIECRLGEELVASDNTKNYVWGVANALSHISRTMTLLPGDVVSMGTAVAGPSADSTAPEIPSITRVNLVGAQERVSITISGFGTLENPVETLRAVGEP